MTTLKRIFALCLLLGLTACGGGGGGSDGGASPNPSSGSGGPNAGGDVGGDDQDGEPSAPDNHAAQATITFPASKSHAIKSLITIRGFATDADGIEEVLVNGIPATLSPATTGSAKPVQKTTVANPAVYESTHSQSVQGVHWSANVSLAPGDNEVSVTVVDESGNVEAGADSEMVSFIEAPLEFSLDEGLNRVIGVAAQQNGLSTQNLVDYDYLNQAQTLILEDIDSYAPTCYKPDSVEFFHLLIEDNNTLVLHSFDLATGIDNVVDSEQLDPVSDGFADAIYTGNMVCGAGHDSVYLLVNYAHNSGGFAKSTILEFDLQAKQVHPLTETDTTVLPGWISSGIALTTHSIIAQGGLDYPGPLIAVDLDNGERSELASGVTVGAVALASGSTTDTVYAVDLDGVHEIDVANKHSKNLSEVDDSNPFVFSQVRQAAFDQSNNRVIVSDSALDMLVSIDLTTGERSELLARSIGSGKKMIAPRALAISSDGTKAYVADDGSNAPEKLFEVDLETGDRRILGHIDQINNPLVNGLALDEENDRVFVAFPQVVLEVQLSTGIITEIASSSVGSGPALGALTDISLDVARGRLVLADGGAEALLALDISTMERSIISARDSAGEGDAFENINSIDLSADGTTAYASNQFSENIMSIDLETGDREIILSECRDQSNINVLGTDGTLQEVVLDESRNQLLVRGDNIIALDLDTLACSIVQPFVAPLLLSLEFKTPDQLLAVAFNSLGQYDIETDEYVIISK